jgi:hypothetical protein
MNKKEAVDGLRNRTLQRIINFFANEGEDVQQTKTGTVMFPAIDELGNECFLTVTVQIPKGSRDGDLYDGYAEAENYRLETKQKQDEKVAKEIAKQKKIERDKKLREEKAKLKKEKETE